MPVEVLFATAFIPSPNLFERISRRQQSAEAKRLLERLQSGKATTASSKSHSRTALAAATTETPELLLGIDIELIEPNRNFNSLARSFLVASPEKMETELFYRCWTFGEAYFKALQQHPSQAVWEDFLSHANANDVVPLNTGLHVFQLSVNDRFRLCLVWKTDSTEHCIVRQIEVECTDVERRKPSLGSDNIEYALANG